MQTALSVATGWALVANGCVSEAVTRCSPPRFGRVNATSRRTSSPACRWRRSGVTRPERRAPRELADELALPLAKAVARHTEVTGRP